jgi:hypothetical protein
MVLEMQPGQVVVHFGTTPGNELTNGKPDWALGCNIYRKRGAETDFTLIAYDAASPYVDTSTGAAGAVAYRVGAVSPAQTVAAGS